MKLVLGAPRVYAPPWTVRSDRRAPRHTRVVPRTRKTVPTADLVEAGAVLRRLLAVVEAGELDADTPQARRLLRRLEGAVAAWEVSRGPLSPGVDP